MGVKVNLLQHAKVQHHVIIPCCDRTQTTPVAGFVAHSSQLGRFAWSRSGAGIFFTPKTRAANDRFFYTQTARDKKAVEKGMFWRHLIFRHRHCYVTGHDLCCAFEQSCPISHRPVFPWSLYRKELYSHEYNQREGYRVILTRSFRTRFLKFCVRYSEVLTHSFTQTLLGEQNDDDSSKHSLKCCPILTSQNVMSHGCTSELWYRTAL